MVPTDITPYPTLGRQVCDFIEQNLVFGPGDLRGQPAVLDDEKRGLVYRMYEVYPKGHAQAGRRRFKRVGVSLRKGTAKTELAAWIAACELHTEAPVRCTGFTKKGEPIGGPVSDPYIPLVAYTEEQSEDLAYGALRVILEMSTLKDDFIIGLERIERKKGDGKAVPLATAPDARDGARTTFQHFDEALALDTPLPTPSGWTTMGAVAVGDRVLGVDGTPCTVIGKSDVHEARPCFRVTFADGTSVVADEGHLWYAHRRGGCGHGQGCRCATVQGWKVRQTLEMTDTQTSNGPKSRPVFTYHVPFHAPFDLPRQDLPVDPYLLGVWLGDGDERNAIISGADADLGDIEAELVGVGYKVSRCRVDAGRASLAYVTTTDSRRGVNGDSVVGRLRRLDVLKNKHIPAIYLRGSFDQRLALLQGLMDSDGHVTCGGYCTFVNTSSALVDGVLELLRTLGYTPRVSWRQDRRSDRYLPVAKVVFQGAVEVPPCRLARKVSRLRDRQLMGHAIVAVEAVASVPVQCIAVDAEDRLFLAGLGMVPTHNTHRFTLPRLGRAHQTMLANIPKRRLADAWSLETTTAPEPGAGSVAEATMEYAKQVDSGLVTDARLFFFHRQASDDCDLSTDEGIRAAVLEASGPAAGWSDIESIAEQFRDPSADRAYLERVWLNRLVRSTVRAFDVEKFKSLVAKVRPVLSRKSVIAIGFDGAQFHDSTAVVATDVVSGYQWLAGVWECPPGRDDWQVPAEDVDALVRQLFHDYEVWRMYADPPFWQSWIAKWAGEFGETRVIEWFTTRRAQMAAALENFNTAIREGRLSHDGSAVLARHLGNAHRKNLPMRSEQGHPLWLIQKERLDSPFKIDATMAQVLSWEARTDAIASGVSQPPKKVKPARIWTPGGFVDAGGDHAHA